MSIHDFFRSIDLKSIEDMVSAGEIENLHLDFKLVSCCTVDKSDRKNYSKALSGYANSEGGIVIWGVDARKNSEGIDCANEIVFLENPELLYQRLVSLESEMVSPTVSGVEHKILDSGDGSNKGLVCTYIPSSFDGPHMAKGGEGRYYVRSGDSFIRMEHFQIADMFGRRKRPVLGLKYEIYRRNVYHSGSERAFEIRLYVENTGIGLAIAPYAAFHLNGPYYIQNFSLARVSDIPGAGARFKQYPSSIGQGWIALGGDMSLVIHPSTNVWAATVIGSLPDDNTKETPDCNIEYKLSADGIMLTEGITSVTVKAIEEYLEI